MPRSGSLRFRLLLGALLSLIVVLGVAGVGLTLLLEKHVARRIESEAANHLDQLVAAFTLDAQGRPQLKGPLSDPRFMAPYSGLYWQVLKDGRPILRSRSLWDFSLGTPDDGLRPGGLHRHQIDGPLGSRLLVLEREVVLDHPVAGTRYRLVSAIDESELTDVVGDFAHDLLLALALLAIILLLASAVQIGYGLLPFKALRRALDEVHRGRNKRLQGSFPSEVRPLVNDLNALLARQEQMVERAQAHAGNLAHALKTPLTILAGLAQRQRGQGSADDSVETLDSEVDRMRMAIERELARARSLAASTSRQAVALRPHAARLIDAIRRLPGGERIDWINEIDAGLDAIVDPGDLDDMLGNLLDNARKWARHKVVVAATAGPGTTRITVTDDGPGLAGADLERIFERGHRQDERQPGHGLGLAIVRDLAELYGGEVAARNRAEGGLEVTVSLPGGGD